MNFNITLYSAFNGCLILDDPDSPCHGMKINPSFQASEVEALDIDEYLEEWVAFMERCVKSGRYRLNPEVVKNPLPAQRQPAQPATLPNNPEQDGGQYAAGLTGYILDGLFPNTELSGQQRTVIVENVCNLTKIQPDMSLDEMKRRADVYLETWQSLKSPETTLAEVRQATDESVAAFMEGGDLDSIPDHQPEPEREIEPDNHLPEFVEDNSKKIKVADQKIKTRIFTKLKLEEGTNVEDKKYTYWVPYYEYDGEDKKQGKIMTWVEPFCSQIRDVIPEKLRPEHPGQKITIPAIRAYYFTVPWRTPDGKSRNRTVWVKFEAAQ